MANILITGISGSLAQRVGELLLAEGHHVTGVDYRPPPASLHPGIDFHQANYNKTRIEDVFKRRQFQQVLHLGRVGNLKESMGKRFDLNVVGSQKIMNLCIAHGVTRLVVMSTFHIYGAHPANHIPIAEEEPLRAGTEFPQIADAIQLDNMATQWVYQHPKVHVVVLRPTNVVGPTIKNAMSSFLRRSRVPYLAGFNPMTQFIFEDDMAGAVIAASHGKKTGVYNVAGPGVMPWRTALEIARAPSFPLPYSAVITYLKMFSAFPLYLVNFFRYPCVITDRRFREDFHWEPKVGLEDTIRRTVEGARGDQGHASM